MCVRVQYSDKLGIKAPYIRTLERLDRKREKERDAKKNSGVCVFHCVSRYN